MNHPPELPSRNRGIDRYAVVGNPVEHSQSPFIHTAFAHATGQTLHYGMLPSELDAFGLTARTFAQSARGLDGVEGAARGCNVTVPFKFEAYDLATIRSERAMLAGAANTLRFDAAGWYADNTDGIGLVRDIEHNAGVDLRGRRVLILGAGGGASGALGPLLQARPEMIRVINRTPAKARALVERHQALAMGCEVDLQAGSLDEPGSDFDLVINGSTSSMLSTGVPLPGKVLRSGSLAIDMMYGAAAQGFVQWAAEHGALGRDGLGMLVEQAAEAFALWRGVRPATTDVLPALRKRLQANTR